MKSTKMASALQCCLNCHDTKQREKDIVKMRKIEKQILNRFGELGSAESLDAPEMNLFHEECK